MTYCDLSSILKDGYVFTLDAEVTVNNLQRLLTNRNLLKKKECCCMLTILTEDSSMLFSLLFFCLLSLSLCYSYSFGQGV